MKRRDSEAKTPHSQEDASHSMEKDSPGQTMPKQTTDVDRLVGIRITALRKARGMSQTALGNAVGVVDRGLQRKLLHNAALAAVGPRARARTARSDHRKLRRMWVGEREGQTEGVRG